MKKLGRDGRRGGRKLEAELLEKCVCVKFTLQKSVYLYYFIKRYFFKVKVLLSFHKMLLKHLNGEK